MMGSVRRKDKAMSQAEAYEFLESGSVGRLGTCADGVPYIVPVNYSYKEGNIYFHCAHEGHKLDNIKKNENVCFEMDEMVSIVQDEDPCNMSTEYKSVVVFGKASILEDEDIKLSVLKDIVKKYSEDKQVSDKLKKEHMKNICIVAIKTDIVTGKKSKC